MPSAPTIASIAAACGVSASTASRALRGAGDLSAATRARIAAEARRVGYDRSATTRGRPRRHADDLIDLVLSHFGGPWADEAIAGARAAASERGYDLVLTGERDAPGDDWPERLRARRPAGVVLGLLLPTEAQLKVVAATGIPVVLLDPRSDQRHRLPSVRSADRTGVRDAARLLRSRGVSAVVVVEGAPSYRFGRDRVAGFLAGLDDGVPYERVHASWGAEEARSAVRPALRRAAAGGGSIGVFACSDEMAVGVYRAADDLGLAVGRDVLVVGFDDIPAAAWLSPPLTTVRQPIRDMAAAAVGAVADIVAGRPAGAEPIEFPTRLIRRGSA